MSDYPKKEYLAPVVVPAAPGYELVVACTDEPGQISGLDYEPIVAWIIRPCLEQEAPRHRLELGDPDVQPVTAEGILTTPWAIKLPSGRIVWPHLGWYDKPEDLIAEWSKA